MSYTDIRVELKTLASADIIKALKKMDIQMNDNLKERIEYLGLSAISKVEWELLPPGPLDSFRNGPRGARLEIDFVRVYEIGRL